MPLRRLCMLVADAQDARSLAAWWGEANIPAFAGTALAMMCTYEADEDMVDHERFVLRLLCCSVTYLPSGASSMPSLRVTVAAMLEAAQLHGGQSVTHRADWGMCLSQATGRCYWITQVSQKAPPLHTLARTLPVLH